MTEPSSPPDRGWIVSIRRVGAERPSGTGVVIDGGRVLTCAHVVRNCQPDQVEVVFPFADDPFGPPVAVSEIRCADHPLADVAVLRLAGSLPTGVRPAPLRRPVGKDLVGRQWWAYGFSDAIGNEAAGVVGGDSGHGWVRVDGESRYSVEPGFSGGGLWSPDYQAVVGLVGQALRTDSRCFTLYAAVKALPDEELSAVIDAWSLEAAGEDAAAAWGWSLAGDVEGRRHWRPRARGVTHDAEQGYRFTGRDTALAEIIDWLKPEQADQRVLVVTGSPGVGKSAVLARIVTTADADVSAEIPTDDIALRAPVGSISCAVHAKGKTALEVAHEISRAASAALPTRLEDFSTSLRDALAEQTGRRFIVVVDALDEASTPTDTRAIVRHILRPLAERCNDLGAGAIVGTRRRDEDGDLLGSFGRAQRQIDLDLPQYFTIEDLAAYALATLQLRGAGRPDNPYNDAGAATSLAWHIAEIAAPNFLVTGLIARDHGLHDEDPAPLDHIGPVFATEDAVEVALHDYLARVPAIDHFTAATILTALAYSQGIGLTLELWQAAVEALTGDPISTAALAGFARGSAANFLIETSTASADGMSYRLFHQALNDALLAVKTEQERIQDQRTLTEKFLSIGSSMGWDQAPAYLCRSLAEHASAGALIDLILKDSLYLLYADLRRLIPIAAKAQTPAGRQVAAMLRRTPKALDADPARRLLLFSITEALNRFASNMRNLSLAAPYRAAWAHVRAGDQIATLEGHTDWVRAVCVVVADERELLASGSDDGTVRLWDPVTGELVDVFDSHAGPVSALCAMQVGERELLVCVGDETLQLWDPVTRELAAALEGRVGPVSAACAVRVGERELLVCVGDETVRLWDPVTGELVVALKGHVYGVRAVCVLQVGERALLASGSYDKTVRLWDPGTGKPVAVLEGRAGPVNAVCGVRVGGRELLAGVGDRTVQLWDPSTGELIAALRSRVGPVSAVCGVQIGQRELLAGVGGREVRLWDPGSGELVAALEGHTDSVCALCVVRVGERELLASGSDDWTVRLWDPDSSGHVAALEGPRRWLGSVNAVCGVRVGGRELLASGSDDETVRLWDPDTGELVAALRGHGRGIGAVCGVRVGGRELLASGSDDETVRLWDPDTGELVTTLKTHGGPVRGLCVVRVGARELLASSGDQAVGLWDLGTGQMVATLGHPVRGVDAVCGVRVPGRELLASGGDRTVRLWDPRTGKLVAALGGHIGRVRALCAVRFGGRELLASGSDDWTVRLWDPQTGKPVAALGGHIGPVRALCMVQAGEQSLLASGGNDRTVRLWDPISSRLVDTLPVHTEIHSIGYLGAGQLVFGLADGILALSLAPDLIM